MIKKIAFFITILVLALVITACSSTKYPVSINGVTIKSEPKKVVSLSPSLSEIIYEIGKLDILSATTQDKNYPNEMQNIEKIGDPANPDLKKIISIKPEIVISNYEISKNDLELLKQNEIQFITIPMATSLKELEDIYIKIARIAMGEIEGIRAAKKAFSELSKSIGDISDKVEALPEKLSFIYINSLDGKIATGDSFEGNLFSVLGKNIAQDSMNYNFDLKGANPSIIIIPSYISIDEIKNNELLMSTDAVKNNRIYVVDSEKISKQSSTIYDILDDLAYKMYPNIFPAPIQTKTVK